MTASDIASYVTQKLEVTDTTTVARATQFAKKAYRDVWNGHAWSDTLQLDITEVTGSSVEITHDQGEVEFTDDSLGVIQAASWNDEPLGFEQRAAIFRLGAQAMTQVGTPCMVTRLPRNTDNNRPRVRLYPFPHETKNLVTLWKKRAPTLADNDNMLLIEGLQTALELLTEAEMLEYLQRRGDAASKRAEGIAAAAGMYEIETRQAATGRMRLIPEGESDGLDNGYATKRDYF